MHDLLNDPLIGVIEGRHTSRVSLPELIARLCAGQIDGYTGLRAHQADPWHVFLVQLAVATLARQQEDAPTTDPGFWRDGLLQLAQGQASAWHLVEQDVTRPAFLQHPWKNWESEAKDYGIESKRGQTSFSPKARTPDELDVLATSKNHDVKASRFAESEIEAWLFSLLMYQTMSGVYGSGNYGIVRMKTGIGSRPIVAWVGDLHPARRFVEELTVVRRIRENALTQTYGYSANGHVLTWLDRWDRQDHQLTLRDLDPCFIEACRPVRLWPASTDGWMALGATSTMRQIGPKSQSNGEVGDPWIPLDKSGAALNLSKDGFTPEKVTRLLLEDGFKLTPLQKPRHPTTPGWFIASVLVRGQGKTEGFHRLELPVPAQAQGALLRPANDPLRQQVAEAARDMQSDVGNAEAVLRTALTVLVQGGTGKADKKKAGINRWSTGMLKRFDHTWPEAYYPMLWRACAEPPEVVLNDWKLRLTDIVWDLFAQAAEQMPMPHNRRWRALTASRSALIGMLKSKHLWTDNARIEEEPA